MIANDQILHGKKVAVLVANGFEHSEFVEPINAVKEAGAEVEVITPNGDKVRSWKEKNWGEEFRADKSLQEVSAADYDALILPGGVINPDQLRDNEKAVEFVKGFFVNGGQKVVAAICHGPWTLINAGVVKDRKLTSYSSLKQDLINAGANWVDEAVVVDNGLVTSRKPEDLEEFNAKLIEEISEGMHH